ncbi:MAG: hypothetical protein A2Y79_02980 [Deltaproteobacteria bacterium RBG_13_43_22]|nr:MAG: hypothetical protein A2Y79_02980 [Deltaproteobacteria bacterium RBG_13_43_22]
MSKPIVLTFNEEELQTIERIDLDSDREGALNFVRETIGKKLKALSRPHCVTVFEVTYSPRQKEAFQPTGKNEHP